MKTMTGMWSALALLLLTNPTIAMDQQLTAMRASTRSGNRVTAQDAAEVVLSALLEAALTELAAHPPILRPRDGLSDGQHKALKDLMAAKVRQRAPLSSIGNAAPAFDTKGASFTVAASKNFDGLNQATACGGCTPSDMGLAVGLSFVVQVVNTAITVFDKNGVQQLGFPKSINTFFGLPANTFTTDPRILYDWVYNRFILIMLKETDPTGPTKFNNRGSLLLAVSKTSDPRGGWFRYRPAFQIGGVGECPDYPTLGQDHTNWPGSSKGGIYVGISQFGPAPAACDGALIQNYVFLLPKNRIYSGLSFSSWSQVGFNVGGTLVDTLQPANVMNIADRPRAEFMVNSFNINFGGGPFQPCSLGCNGLVVWAISNPFGFLLGGPNPEFTGVAIATDNTYFLPTGANEPGCSHCIETIDTRITGSVNYTAGALFAALETAVLGTESNTPLWFELHPVLNDNDSNCTGAFVNQCPQITSVDKRQEGCFACNGGWIGNGSAYFATLQPDPQGNVTMVFNFSNDDGFPGTAYTSRRVSEEDGQMHDFGIFLQAGQAFYGQSRWGDYTGTALDLSSTALPSMWFSGMYAKLDGTWGTTIGRNSFTAPNQP